MLKITHKAHVLSLAAFAALAIVPMGARADGGDYTLPAAKVSDVRSEERAPAKLTCAEATKAAWFLRELERSDGDVAPEMQTPQECQREIYATADKATE